MRIPAKRLQVSCEHWPLPEIALKKCRIVVTVPIKSIFRRRLFWTCGTRLCAVCSLYRDKSMRRLLRIAGALFFVMMSVYFFGLAQDRPHAQATSSITAEGDDFVGPLSRWTHLQTAYVA